MKKLSLLFWLGISTISNLFCQYDGRFVGEPGKCYAKCETTERSEIINKKLPRYTGKLDKDLIPKITYTIEVEPQENGFRWEKRKTTDCISSNPDDCYVWCKIPVVATNGQEYIVKDTTLIRDFEMIEVPVKFITQKAGKMEYVEIICANFLTSKVIKKIQQKLLDQGFYDGAITGSIDSTTKNAISDFQKSNLAYHGAITTELLQALKIKY
jgi:hypothetical protein